MPCCDCAVVDVLWIKVWMNVAILCVMSCLIFFPIIQALSGIDLPEGWEWIGDWHLDTKSTNTSDGWIYAPDVEKLRWPESFDPKESSNCARQRRWLRSRKLIADCPKHEISVGLLQPGETVPLPLSGLTQSVQYFLKLRPWTSANSSEYNWSSVVNRPSQPEDAGKREQCSKLCVSALSESEELLCCSEMHGTSDGSHKLWFCVSIQATEIAKDMHSDAIQDWCLVVKSPLQISNFLPLAAEYSVLEMQPSGHFLACSRGIFLSGKTVHIYTADIRNPLFLSLLPQRGWLPIHVRYRFPFLVFLFLLHCVMLLILNPSFLNRKLFLYLTLMGSHQKQLV